MQCKTERATRTCDQCTFDRRRNLSWGGGKSHLCFVCFAVSGGPELWPAREFSFSPLKPPSRRTLLWQSQANSGTLTRTIPCSARWVTLVETCRLRTIPWPYPAHFSRLCSFHRSDGFNVLAFLLFFSHSGLFIQLFPQERHADTPELINHTFTAIETAGISELLCSLCDRPASRRSGQVSRPKFQVPPDAGIAAACFGVSARAVTVLGGRFRRVYLGKLRTYSVNLVSGFEAGSPLSALG